MNLRMVKYWRIDSSYKVAGITVTDEGFWEIDGVAAVVGPMTYMDADGNEHIEYVTPQVLEDYAHALIGKPVTNDHPPRRVDPENYKTYTIGTVIDCNYDPDSEELRVKIVVNDADAQSDIDRGRIELSPGYLAGLSEPPPDFEHEADYIQVSRTYNHLAIVDEARGGANVRLHLDSKGDASMEEEKEKEDMMKEDMKEQLDAMKEKYDALQAKFDVLQAKMDAMMEKEDAEEEEEVKEVEDKENLDGVDFETRFAEAFEEHRRAIEAAERLGVKVARKDSTFAIKKKVASSKLGSNFRADASKEYIEAAFDSVVELYPARDSVESLSILRNDGVSKSNDEYGFLDDVVDPLESLKAKRSNK